MNTRYLIAMLAACGGTATPAKTPVSGSSDAAATDGASPGAPSDRAVTAGSPQPLPAAAFGVLDEGDQGDTVIVGGVGLIRGSAIEGSRARGKYLDKRVISDAIKRHRAAIRACYETALAATPGLTGKVTVAFTIGGDGRVASSKAQGLPPVEGCVADVIRTIEFPPPEGGGSVNVSYPFSFRAQ